MKQLLNNRAKMVSKSLLRSMGAFGFSEVAQFNNNFLSTTNLAYIESLYEKWQHDKSSVSKSYQAYFELLERGEQPDMAYVSAPRSGEQLQIDDSSTSAIAQQLKYRMLIDRIRFNGHQFSKMSPLNYKLKGLIGELDRSVIQPASVGMNESESMKIAYHKNQRLDQVLEPKGQYPIKQVAEYLESVYCDTVGYQYMHLEDKNERVFLRNAIEQNIESLQTKEPTKAERLDTFKRLCKDQAFVDVLGTKFANFKRFGIEGLNAASSAMGELFETAAEQGAEYLVLGMAHRGRLNALHCLFDKPAQIIFQQFLEKKKEGAVDFSAGDVKYHLGYINKRKYGDKQLTLSLLPNPSHLEAVNPLVYGQTRALQEQINDINREKVIGVIVHGDAAVAGQGIVYETIEMNELKEYTCGGIIHIVMNNQVGFTTNPTDARSSYYCTEIAKVIKAPVFHVNADEPDVLDRCMKIALAYRYKFKKDIFIDIVGYRRYGHNEQDQPFFTQPKMYEEIKNKPSVFEVYSKKMIDKGVLTKEEVNEYREKYQKRYEEDYAKVISDKADAKPSSYTLNEIQPPKLWGKSTGVPKDVLGNLFKNLTTWPEDFNIHPTIKKIYEERIKNFTSNEPLDWATMESLAFASLLHEGYEVRLSGQDVERGTFSHRHALISDQKRDVPKYAFLKSVSPKVTISNSHLSEYGVMGFEYGYSITNPNALVIWEAQFGDFANGAQIIIDNFVVSSETKWGQSSGLVLNLPHGMDGQGPEHSSGRIERFLLLSDDNCDVSQNLTYQQQLASTNINVVSCSTSANYFHILRRQLHRDYRKPLILFNSKKLLKFKPANRPMSEILEGTDFVPVYPDESGASPSKIKKVFLCNGQFYYELRTMRDELKRDDIAIVRVEELAPFPHEQIKKTLSVYNADVEYFWVQEDHENYGAWNYIRPRLRKLLGKSIGFHGRKASASTAVGYLKKHKKQEKQLLQRVFGLSKQ